MASKLPRLIVLKSTHTNKYVRYIHQDVQLHGYLQASGEEVLSIYSKIEVEISKTSNELVHLRCSYNNKYWVRSSQNQNWLIASAEQPEEDQSKWTCTLFKPDKMDFEPRIGDDDQYRFTHVQLGYFVGLTTFPGKSYDYCLYAAAQQPTPGDVFHVTDWESLVILPQYIAFKGDNDKYLGAHWVQNHEYLEFMYDDVGNQNVGNEVFTNPDGTIRINNDHWGKFWRRSPNWIWADSTDTSSNNADTLFQPVKVGDNVVALRNLGNNNFCGRLTTEGKTNCLNANTPTISKEARLVVEEPVVSRQIYNIDFHLLDARIYSETVLTMANNSATNGSDETSMMEISLGYTESKSSTWNASISLKLGIKTEIKSSVPFIGEAGVEMSTEIQTAYEWGETVEESQDLMTSYTTPVPPMTKVTVFLLATRGSCDVPFSYTQVDTLTNGNRVTYYKDDGIYTGINCYNFRYETKQESLLPQGEEVQG